MMLSILLIIGYTGGAIGAGIMVWTVYRVVKAAVSKK